MLTDAAGAVVTKTALRQALSEACDDHALEVAIGRLRKALNHPGIIPTVTKRGYRLNI